MQPEVRNTTYQLINPLLVQSMHNLKVRNTSYQLINSLLIQSMHNLEARNTSYQLISSLFIFSLFSSQPELVVLVVVTLPTKGSISTVSSAFFLNRTPIGSPVSPRRALTITLFLNFNFLRLISAPYH